MNEWMNEWNCLYNRWKRTRRTTSTKECGIQAGEKELLARSRRGGRSHLGYKDVDRRGKVLG